MKIIDKAYQCSHCGRLFLTAAGTNRHERTCRKNPAIARACYTCAKFHRACYEDEKETVEGEFDCGYGCVTERKTFRKNTCGHDNAKLFTPVRMNAGWREWIENTDGWKAMPSVEEGCPDYEMGDYSFLPGGMPKYPVPQKDNRPQDKE